jgi:2'-5' RNA ligase
VTALDIGVAIDLPEPYAAELQGWRLRLGDPHADRVPPHITLLPPTPVPADRLPAVREHLLGVAAGQTPFDVRLRGSATFRPVSPVVFVPLVAGISQCELLQAAVRSGPIARDLAFPYHPHVTVAHDLDEPALDRAFEALADYDAAFTVWGFTLFDRGRDGTWRPQRDFILGPAPVRPAVG